MFKQNREFGSYAGVDELCVLLDEQALILKDLKSDFFEANNPVLLVLLDALGSDLRACEALGRMLLINQLTLLSRVVVERAARLCFIYFTDAIERGPSFSPVQSCGQGVEFKKQITPEELAEKSLRYEGELTEPAQTPTFWEQIAILEGTSSKRVVAFRMLAAFVWQKSQWIWEGDVTGAACHFASLKEESSTIHHLRQEAVPMLFQIISIVDALVQFLAHDHGFGNVEYKIRIQLKASGLATLSDANIKRAASSITIGQVTQDNNKLDDQWSQLSYVEQITSPQVSRTLREWEPWMAKCYELGITVPRLNEQFRNQVNIQMAGLFLKRTLTDLRVVWNTVNEGYTVQAAATAAGLFEHAVLVTALASSIKRANQMLNSKTGDSPWDVKCLCSFEVEAWQRKQQGKPRKVDMQKKDLQQKVDDTYVHYRYLCKIKHPTMGAAIHSSRNTDFKGNYVIMAAPDLRNEDLPLKNYILSVCLERSITAIIGFADALFRDEATGEIKLTPEGNDFFEQLHELTIGCTEKVTVSAQSPLPF